MVGRLIQNDHVRLRIGETSKGHAGLLASRHKLHGLHSIVAGDLVSAQVRAELRLLS